MRLAILVIETDLDRAAQIATEKTVLDPRDITKDAIDAFFSKLGRESRQNERKSWEDIMLTRRKLLKTGTAAGLALSAGGLAAPALASGAKIKLGYVSPQSAAGRLFRGRHIYYK